MAPDPHIDKLFDNRYLIKRKLGSGGMADVYLADDQELGRQVALKMLNERHANDEQFVERFRREAQNAASLNHPNIVSIFDRGQGEDTYYIAMEFLDGRSLKELLVRNGPTPIPIAIDYARQILAGLGFAHKNGIVHRDIKPHNIVVGLDGRLKVTDFGIARSGTSQMTEAGSIVGTAQYLSPEQARGAPVDPRSDLYSLGIVLYEMLTGEVPFTGDAPVEIAMKHLSAIPDPPSLLRPEVPRDLDAIVMRALAKDPDQRYDSAEDMDADLDRVARGAEISARTEDALTQVLSGEGIAAAQTMLTRPRTVAPPVYRPPTPYYDYDEKPRRRSLLPWLLGLLAIVIAAGAGFLIYQKVQTQLDQNKTVGVDNVVGLQKAQAEERLGAQGLQVTLKRQPSDTVPINAVIEQTPLAGDHVAKDSTVILLLSSGKRKTQVPAVKGLTLEAAQSTLVNAGLKALPRYVFSDTPANTVTAQDPAALTSVPAGSDVHINISKGLKPVDVPDVTHYLYDVASSLLVGQGFAVVRSDVNSDKPSGRVISQSPAAHTGVPKGTTVTLTVSKGLALAQIPDVTGNSPGDAALLLKNAGFGSTGVKVPVTDPTQDGIVIAQNPVGLTQAKPGTVVTLNVGQFTATSSTTTTTTTTTTTPLTTSTIPPATTP